MPGQQLQWFDEPISAEPLGDVLRIELPGDHRFTREVIVQISLASVTTSAEGIKHVGIAGFLADSFDGERWAVVPARSGAFKGGLRGGQSLTGSIRAVAPFAPRLRLTLSTDMVNDWTEHLALTIRFGGLRLSDVA